MRPGAAETQMRVRITRHVEGLGVVEDRLVPIARRIEQQQLVPGRAAPARRARSGSSPSAASTSPGSTSGRSPRPPWARPPSKSACHRSRWAGFSVSPTRRVADRVAGRLVAGHRQQDEERADLAVGQPLTVNLGVGQRANQVGRRIVPSLPGQPLHQVRQLRTRPEQDRRQVTTLWYVLRVRRSQDDVGVAEDHLLLVARAHPSARR